MSHSLTSVVSATTAYIAGVNKRGASFYQFFLRFDYSTATYTLHESLVSGTGKYARIAQLFMLNSNIGWGAGTNYDGVT